MRLGVEDGVYDVSVAPSDFLAHWLTASVYGYCILIGSVIGCIAGVPGVNGYGSKSNMFNTMCTYLTRYSFHRR